MTNTHFLCPNCGECRRLAAVSARCPACNAAMLACTSLRQALFV